MVEPDLYSKLIHSETALPARTHVRIMAIGRESTVDRLRRKVPHWCWVHASGSVADAIQAMRTHKCEYISLDPSQLRLDVMIDAAIAAEQHGVGCVLYATFSHLAATQSIGVMRKARCELIFIGAAQEASLLARCFRSASQISAAALVAGELAARLLGLPSDIGASFVGVFGGLSMPVCGGAPAGSNRSAERRIERACKKAGLAAPSQILTGVRIANCWHALRDGHEISEVALRQSWDSAARFRRNFRKLIGVSPSVARNRMQTGEFASQLATALSRRPSSEQAAHGADRRPVPRSPRRGALPFAP